MLEDLSLGIYYPGRSILHRLRARTKLVALLWLALLLVVADRHRWQFAPYVAVVMLTLAAVAVSGVPPRAIWRQLRLLLLAVAIGSIPVVLFTEGTPLRTIGPVVVTNEGMWLVFVLFVLLPTLFTLSMLLTMTTPPVAMLEGMTILLAPLRRLRLPVDDFALMTLIALRFIPTLVEETDQLIKAQTARGADLLQGKILDRMRSIPALFVPLVHGALRRADDLATALESRGYDTENGPTMLHEGPLGTADYAAFGILVLIAIVTFAF